jgi:hypothetical protein
MGDITRDTLMAGHLFELRVACQAIKDYYEAVLRDKVPSDPMWPYRIRQYGCAIVNSTTGWQALNTEKGLRDE